MPLLGARTKDQLLKRLASKWFPEEDEPATKVAKRPSADPSVIKRPANETVLKRPSAKRPASAIEEDETEEESQAKHRDRNKDGWLKRNMKSLPEGIVATIEKTAPGKRTQITNAIVEKSSDGSWNFNLEHPIVQEVLRKEEGSYYQKARKVSHLRLQKTHRLCCRLGESSAGRPLHQHPPQRRRILFVEGD